MSYSTMPGLMTSTKSRTGRLLLMLGSWKLVILLDLPAPCNLRSTTEEGYLNTTENIWVIKCTIFTQCTFGIAENTSMKNACPIWTFLNGPAQNEFCTSKLSGYCATDIWKIMDSDGYIDPDLFFWSKDCQMPNNTSLNVGVLLLHLDEMQVYHTLPPPLHPLPPPSQTQSMDASQSLSNSLLRLTYTPWLKVP